VTLGAEPYAISVLQIQALTFAGPSRNR